MQAQKNGVLLAILIFIFSCTKPKADFQVQSESNYTFEQIYFKNLSVKAFYYLWYFGDGDSSEAVNPVHIYKKSGEYTVKLIASSPYTNRIDEKIVILNIIQPTDILARVLSKATFLPVSDCNVALYGNYTDWKNDSNRILSKITDENGFVYFRCLEPVNYYFYAYKMESQEIFSNRKLGYVTKKPLIANSVNYFDIYIVNETEN